MKYYIIAGERSGDLHAANLARALRAQDPTASFRGVGGDLMEAAGVDTMMHYQDIAFMGVMEVLSNINTLRKALKDCKEDLLAYAPDVVILIDFAGFNLRVARFAKEHGLRTFYYISPKIWAWNTKRAHQIKEQVDRMFVILPFEKDFYATFDYDVDYVGNPVLDAVADFEPTGSFRQQNGLDERPIVAVLPGSRRQEVRETLHFMVSILPPFMDHQFVVAAVPNVPREYYEYFRRHNVHIVYDQTYELLANARAALVTSGTATLETALFDVPQVVCYRSSFVTYMVGKAVIKVDYISLVNLIMGREVVKELIQEQFTPANLMRELTPLLRDEDRRREVRADYEAMRELLGTPGASARTAQLMHQYLCGQPEPSK